jgi:hypothetical protein
MFGEAALCGKAAARSPKGRGRNRPLVDDECCFDATSMELLLRACKGLDQRITNDTPHPNENLRVKRKYGRSARACGSESI